MPLIKSVFMGIINYIGVIILKKYEQYFMMFLMGGVIYGAVEVMFRGYTHWSMIITGGSALLAIYMIDDALPNLSIFIKAIAGAAVITTLEFTVGIVVNRIFMLGVWDYSDLKGNILGQISPLFSLCWYFLSIAAFYICRQTKRIMTARKS